MARSSQYRMADRLAGGRLAESIAERLAEGLSFDAIASRLYADFGIETTGPTVQAWSKPDQRATA